MCDLFYTNIFFSNGHSEDCILTIMPIEEVFVDEGQRLSLAPNDYNERITGTKNISIWTER